MILCQPDTSHFPQTPVFPPGEGLWSPSNLSVSCRGFPRVKVLFWDPSLAPQMSWYQGVTVCFLGNHSVEKVNFLSL